MQSKSPSCLPTHESGFALVEAMVSLTIAILTLLAVLSLYQSTIMSRSWSDQRSEAQTIAVSTLESTRLKQRPALSTLEGAPQTKTINGASGARYTVLTQALQMGDSYRLTVRVTWGSESYEIKGYSPV